MFVILTYISQFLTDFYRSAVVVAVSPQAHWWAILLAILTLSGVMAGTVLVFGRPLEMDDTE